MKLIYAFLCVCVAYSVQAQTRFQGKLTPIQRDGIEGTVFDGILSVPEEPSSLVGKQIELHITVLPALNATPKADPLLVLKGPVSFEEQLSFYAQHFPELRKDRDILLIDQRGSWASNPIDVSMPRYANSIYTYTDEKQFAQKIGTSIREAQQKANLNLYTNKQVVADVEAVRKWLEYDQLNIWALGDGTVTAQIYSSTYPDRVRSIVLQSMQPTQASPWLAKQAMQRIALKEVVKDCHADSLCRAAFPELSEHFGLLYDRLAKMPEYTDLQLPDGSMTKIGIDHIVLEDIIDRQMMSTTERSLIPWIVEGAYYGDMQILAQRADIAQREIPLGTWACITCNEDPIHKAPRGILYDDKTPFTSFFQHKTVQLCRAWPKVETGKEYLIPSSSSAPTLVLIGDADHTTSVDYANTQTAKLKNSKQVVLSGRAKKDVDSCTIDLITEMVQKGSAKNLDESCAQEKLVVPFYVP